MEPYRLTASEAARLIRAKTLSAEELTRSCLARIEARDPEVRAWATFDPDKAIRAARELDKTLIAHGPVGPLHGLPFGVKDMIDTIDHPTTNNSPIYVGNQPSHDAHAVRVVKAQGAFVLGKTDTVEFAAGGRKALTRNPRDSARTPGGTSSGSGAAVGDWQVPLAFGTQTAGSHIRPASFNGVYALKPTCNVLSWTGARQYGPTLDTIGWYGRAAEDLTLVASAFRLRGVGAVPTPAVKGLKVGLAHTHNLDRAEPAGREALALAAERLADTGAVVEEIALPPDFARLNEAQMKIMFWEGRAQFLPDYLESYDKLHPDFRLRVESDEGVTADEIRALYDLVYRCRAAFDALFGPTLDVVLTFSAPGEAPVGLHTTGDWIMNAMWTVLNVPCLAIPCHTGPNGLPVGVQIVGPRWSDAQLLAIGEAVAPVIDAKGTLEMSPRAAA
jgi:Asp-tRNA(Asn)/Glu-tRNA(Gln) amidotransferase A subunit family amidase